MKCPKCHYLSFDPEPRCKNCGFTLALDEGDLAIQPGAGVSDAVMVDWDLRPAEVLGHDDAGEVAGAPLMSRPAPRNFEGRPPAPDSAPVTPRPPRRAAGRAGAAKADETRDLRAPSTAELPLFMKAIPDVPFEATEESLIASPTPSPAARKAGDTASLKLGPLDRDLLDDLKRLERTERRASLPDDRARAGRRLGAAAFDAVFVGGLSTGMLWMTLRWCDLSWSQWAVLPIAPTLAFLALVGLGYLLMFTSAGGQTIGKMLFGIRVVGAGSSGDGHETLTVSQAFYREIVVLPSVLALGAGFVPALVGQGRAVHDRIAETRVVRA